MGLTNPWVVAEIAFDYSVFALKWVNLKVKNNATVRAISKTYGRSSYPTAISVSVRISVIGADAKCTQT